MDAAQTRPVPWQAWLIWAGPLLLVAGFIGTDILRALPHAHAAELLAITALAVAAAGLLHRVARVRWANALA